MRHWPGALERSQPTDSPELPQDLASNTFIDISAVPELASVQVSDNGITVGAATKISDLSMLFKAESGKSQSFASLHAHMNKVASWNVRNAGSFAGNLVMAREYAFASDLATIFMGTGASLSVLIDGNSLTMSIEDFLWLPSLGESPYLIVSMTVPFCAPSEYFFSFRQALRTVNAHALLNAGFRATMDGTTISSCSMVHLPLLSLTVPLTL